MGVDFTIDVIKIKQIIESLAVLTQSVIINFNKNGLYLSAMDMSHVAMCFLKLKKTDFLKYNCDVPVSLSISIQNLSLILKSCKSNDVIRFFHSDINTDVLNLEFIGDSRTSFYELKLMDIDEDSIEMSELDYDIIININSNYFNSLIKELHNIGTGNELKIVMNDSLLFSTNGDIGKLSIDVKECKIETITLDSNSSEFLFSLNHIIYFTKATPVSDNIIIKLGKDLPLYVNYGPLTYFLAPKIE